jgi:hypothetical protein
MLAIRCVTSCWDFCFDCRDGFVLQGFLPELLRIWIARRRFARNSVIFAWEQPSFHALNSAAAFGARGPE